jgi:hypothetical protein
MTAKWQSTRNPGFEGDVSHAAKRRSEHRVKKSPISHPNDFKSQFPRLFVYTLKGQKNWQIHNFLIFLHLYYNERMSFNFTQFPFYNPLQREHWQPEKYISELHTPHVRYSLDTEHGQLHATLKSTDYNKTVSEILRNNGCALVTIEFDSQTSITISFTPLGHVHAIIDAANANSDFFIEVDSRIHPHSISISKPPIELVAAYTTTPEWILRTDLVRWMYPLQYSIDQWSSKERYALQRQLVKSKKLQYEVTTLNEIHSKIFLKIWNKEIISRKGGTRIFYDRVFQDSATFERDIPIVLFYENNSDTVTGAAVINPFGGYSDFKSGESNYYSLWMQAYSKSLLQYAPAYRTASIINNYGRERGDSWSSQGADISVWGTEIHNGLLQQKSTLMMYPYPENNIELFSIRRPHDMLRDSGESHLLAYSVNANTPLIRGAMKNGHHIKSDVHSIKNIDHSTIGSFVAWSPHNQSIHQKIPQNMKITTTTWNK